MKSQVEFDDQNNLNILNKIERQLDTHASICLKYGTNRQSILKWQAKRKVLGKAVIEDKLERKAEIECVWSIIENQD